MRYLLTTFLLGLALRLSAQSDSLLREHFVNYPDTFILTYIPTTEVYDTVVADLLVYSDSSGNVKMAENIEVGRAQGPNVWSTSYYPLRPIYRILYVQIKN